MNDCQHEKILIVTRYYPGTYYEPPETEILHCECRQCDESIDYADRAKGDESIDYADRAKDASVKEIDHRDYALAYW